MVDNGGGVIVTLNFDDLVNDVDLSDLIEQAFGWDGIGLLTVKNIPDLSTLRSRLLPLAREFSLLDESAKLKYTQPESKFSFGWSHGKEKLEGRPDLSKGSYYANPLYDKPVEDEDLISRYPAFISPNIWPREDLPALEVAFKDLGKLIVSVGLLVSKQCDRYIKKKCPSYREGKLHHIVQNSLCCKARLLHYFPFESSEESLNDESNFSSWCGWHNDHGSLTGLTAAMFMDPSGSVAENKDPSAGLYIRNRKSEVIKASIPPDHIAFQIGETAQIHSGGILQVLDCHFGSISRLLHISSHHARTRCRCVAWMAQ